jgi:hypothetical protein
MGEQDKPQTEEEFLDTVIDDKPEEDPDKEKEEGKEEKTETTDEEVDKDDGFFVGTYKSKESAEQGIAEKDRVIDLLKNKLDKKDQLIEQQLRQKQQQPTPNNNENDWERYEEEFEKLVEDKGLAYAIAQTARQMSVLTREEERAEESVKRQQYEVWKDQVKDKYNLNDEQAKELVEKLDRLNQQESTNPLEFILEVTRNQKPVKDPVEELNRERKKNALIEEKKQLSKIQTTERKAGPTPNLFKEKREKAFETKDEDACLDGIFDKHTAFLQTIRQNKRGV